MPDTNTSAPPPELRIVPTEHLHPHEEHDSQRALPLIERLRQEAYVINPPVVAPMNGDDFVILDGANRCFAFARLGYAHSLVQIARYDSNVELDTWQHVVADWTRDEFIQHLRQLPGVREGGPDDRAVARVRFHDGQVLALTASAATTHERNAALRQVVGTYQRNAVLHRTATTDPGAVWDLFPQAIALVSFPRYTPADIVSAARERAYLPPGVSRHIVHGRAIRVNYPIDALRDTTTPLAEKNRSLHVWLQSKMANRQVRYYAESTYQFDE